MRLNSISPASGSTRQRKRVGRGVACGNGKTCGRGHKGQHSRSGGYHKVGFEGGQMPLQRRVPKFGFTSRKGLVTAEIYLSDLNRVEGDVIDIEALLKANLITHDIRFVKVIAGGEITRAVTLKSIRVTASVLAAVEKAGGKVEGV